MPRTILIALLLGLGPVGQRASADGGRLCLVDRLGDYQLSVFTSPNPLRAGPIDVSVLVQDFETGQPVADVDVTVTLTSSGSTTTLQALATSEAATNKLLRAALLELPEAGKWDIEVTCAGPHGRGSLHVGVDAGHKLPPWLSVWPWFSWPSVAIALFGVHRLLVWGRGRTG